MVLILLHQRGETIDGRSSKIQPKENCMNQNQQQGQREEQQGQKDQQGQRDQQQQRETQQGQNPTRSGQSQETTRQEGR